MHSKPPPVSAPNEWKHLRGRVTGAVAGFPPVHCPVGEHLLILYTTVRKEIIKKSCQ